MPSFLKRCRALRAVYLKDLTISDQYVLRDETHHHLVHVVRIENGEEILLLDGKGQTVVAEVTSFNKKEVLLKKISEKFIEPAYQIDVALGVPKKDAFDLCMKQVVELGIGKVYLVRSNYSQMKVPEGERIEKLLVSGLEQSNSAYLTSFSEVAFKEIDYSQYQSVVLLDSQNNVESASFVKGKILLIVGPEGGFSPEEFQFFESIPQLVRLNLPTPIMRTPTALSCGTGIVLQRLMD